MASNIPVMSYYRPWFILVFGVLPSLPAVITFKTSHFDLCSSVQWMLSYVEFEFIEI